jgi:hypothetical protein
MTTQQLYLFNFLYLAIFCVVAILTRATARRIAGAAAGAAVAGVVALAIVALGETVGWWHMTIIWESYYLALMWIDFALCGFIFLVTWRIARRFGWRGLAVAASVVAIMGPLRDRWYMERFPEWGAYAPGIAPFLVISVTYVFLGTLGHTLMRLIAGPSCGSLLARRPWEAIGTDGTTRAAFWDFNMPGKQRNSLRN